MEFCIEPATVQIELLPRASAMRFPPRYMSSEDEQILEEEVKESLDNGIVERVKSSKWVFPFFKARGKSRSSRRRAKKRSTVDIRQLSPWLKVIEYPFPVGKRSWMTYFMELDVLFTWTWLKLTIIRHGCLTIRVCESELVRIKVLPLRVSSAVALFQRQMKKCLERT